MFLELQQAQIEKWLLNPGMYALVGLLLLISMVRGVEAMDRRFWHATGGDFLYGIMYAGLYFPAIAITLHLANSWIDETAPWLRVELIYQAPEWAKLLIIVLVDDFLAYWSHRLRHKYRPLWYFHAIHHSQERLNPFTTKRFHPLENLFHKLVILTIPMAILGGSMETWYLYFLLDAAWDYFIHSNIRMDLGPLKYIVVTPQFHRVHHSRRPEHFDKNYSDRLVIWDYLFGTASKDTLSYPTTGIPGYSIRNSASPLGFVRQHLSDLWYPFKMIVRDIKTGELHNQR